MLVLTRKTNESIYIDGGIEVMVVQVRGNRVRLGFRAPSDISIQRKERMAEPVAAAPGLPRIKDAPSTISLPVVREVRSRPR
ncbi:MAG: carbon storage regulator [Deltaproteobacteria bacterium]